MLEPCTGLMTARSRISAPAKKQHNTAKTVVRMGVRISRQSYLRPTDFFFLRLPNGLGTALLGTVSTFLTASRKRINASGPSIISRVAGFIRLD